VSSPLAILLFALAVRTLLVFQLRTAQVLGFPRPSLAWICVVLALTCPAGIVIHELGHYLAGIAVGHRCRRIVLGPVEFAHGDGGWKVRCVPLRRAGLVDFVPPDYVRYRRKRALCVAAGPAASLLACTGFTWLSLHASTASLFWICSFCAQWSLVGALGLVPLRRGEARSDGYLLWELLR
jgi:Peptidase family M50